MKKVLLLLAIVYLAFLAFGAGVSLGADYALDIDQIYYQDASEREIDYDFSAGVIDPDGDIIIPESAIISVPLSETDTIFLWESGFDD